MEWPASVVCVYRFRKIEGEANLTKQAAAMALQKSSRWLAWNLLLDSLFAPSIRMVKAAAFTQHTPRKERE
jgi:hypothetical protein